MTDHKFTDDEIIKGFELCFTPKGTKDTCTKCPFHEFRALCKVERDRAAIDLIKRQKAEIERIQKERRWGITLFELEAIEKHARNKAIKEFAERLLKKIYPYAGVDKKTYAINAYAVEKTIEGLVKEITEESNETKKTVCRFEKMS